MNGVLTLRTLLLILLIACSGLGLSGCKRGRVPATHGPYANVVDVFLADNAGFQALMQGLPDFSTVYIHAPESGAPFSRQNDPGATGDVYVLLQGRQHIEIIGVSNSFGQKPLFRETDWLLRQIFSLVDCQHVTIRNIAFETLHTDSLWFTDVSYVDLIDISHEGVVRDSAIAVSRWADVVIAENVFLDQTGQPLRSRDPSVHIEHSKDFSVFSNSFVNVRIGIDLLGNWRNGSLTGNTVSQARVQAILLRGRSKTGTDAVVISGNALDLAGCPGIFPTEGCVGVLLSPVPWLFIGDVTLTDNVIENATYAVGILAGQTVDVLSNTLQNVDYGVGVAGGDIVNVIGNLFSNVAIENVPVDPAFSGQLTIQ